MSINEAPPLSEQSANRIGAVSSHGHRSSRKTDTSSVKCYACDKKGQYRLSPECPAKDKNCSQCDERGLFAKCCINARHRSASRNRGRRRTYCTGAGTGDMTMVAMVARTDNCTGEFKTVCCLLNNVNVNLMIDLGAIVSLINYVIYNKMF